MIYEYSNLFIFKSYFKCNIHMLGLSHDPIRLIKNSPNLFTLGRISTSRDVIIHTNISLLYIFKCIQVKRL